MSGVMIPMEIVIGLSVSIPSAITAAGRALWLRVAKVEKDAREATVALTTRITELEKSRDDYIAKHDDCLMRLAREMERGAHLAFLDTSQGPPKSLPAPPWEEDTNVRNMRAQIEKTVLDKELETYVKPRPKMPSRPR